MICLSRRMPCVCARPKMTKANSPPCASSRPDRMAVPGLRRARVQTRATMNDLRVKRPMTMPSTRGALANAMPTSIEKPVVMKKRPSSRPRKGAMSAWVRVRGRVSPG